MGARMSEHVTPAAGQWVRVSDHAELLRAPNPGPMTLDGTNSYRMCAPGADRVVIVDPGPADQGHLDAVAERPVELILITHGHADHTAGAAALAARTGAPVRAAAPEHCRSGGPLMDEEELVAAGVRLTALHTPGHTGDSFSFWNQDDGGAGSVCTGDTVLGRGTTVISHPDGELGAYLESLRLLSGIGPATVLPGHGPPRKGLTRLSQAYLAHRQERLDQVRGAVRRLGRSATVSAVTDLVYVDIEPSVRDAAELSVRAQLAYLRERGGMAGSE